MYVRIDLLIINHTYWNLILVAAEMETYIAYRILTLIFLISDFRRDLNIVYFLLGISPASNCSWPTFRNPVSVPSSKAGCRVCTHCTPSLWRWSWYRVPKRRPTTIWRRGNTQKKIYKTLILYYEHEWWRFN